MKLYRIAILFLTTPVSYHKVVSWYDYKVAKSVIMPPTTKKFTGHIGFGLCVGPSVHQEPCMLGFWNFIWIPHGKIFDTRFFSCLSYLPFRSYAALNKIRMKSDTCHILWTVHARVLKFHIWIPHGKIADHFFFSCSIYLPFWIYALWKNQNEILSARYLEKYLR